MFLSNEINYFSHVEPLTTKREESVFYLNNVEKPESNKHHRSQSSRCIGGLKEEYFPCIQRLRVAPVILEASRPRH